MVWSGINGKSLTQMKTTALFSIPFIRLRKSTRCLTLSTAAFLVCDVLPVALGGSFGGAGFAYPLQTAAFLNAGVSGDKKRDDKGNKEREEEGAVNPRRMGYGPVIGQSYRFPDTDQNTVGRGLGIRLRHGVRVVFDKELIRYAIGTVGGVIDLSDTDYMRSKGGTVARLDGSLVFASDARPGWSPTGSFKSPREGEHRPLPSEWARYNGYYRWNDRVILSYEVGAASILEMPTAVKSRDQVGVVRHIRVEGVSRKVTAHLAQVVSSGKTIRHDNIIELEDGKEGKKTRFLALHDAPEGVRLTMTEKGEVLLEVSAPIETASFEVLNARAPNGDRDIVQALLDRIEEREDLKSLTQGGNAQWPKVLKRKEKTAESDGAYVVDSIPVPQENPWHSFIRISGLDFFPDGRAAVCTMNGDVWLVRGLSSRHKMVRWKRYASGLYQPLGLAIQEGDIFVVEQGQITRLTDLNGDNEADFYENFNYEGPFKPRAYWLCLDTDSEGNFYYGRVGNRARRMPEHGCIVRVDASGQSAEVFATGLRQSNGLAIGPDDMIHATDQEGNWVPATRIDRIEKGEFYGYRPNAAREIPVGNFSKPICWLPKNVDNSAGSQVFVDSDRWGPLAGRWLHTSWGLARLYLVLTETVQGIKQGGVVEMPTGMFQSGIMRAEVNPTDGQVYVAGLGVPGWTGVGIRPACFNRIRYTGRSTLMPVELHARTDGVEIVFGRSLNAKQARDPENYTVKRWTYEYSKEYGSPEYSVANPDTTGRDPVKLSDVSLGKQRRRVILHIPDMQPVMQMMIEYDIESRDGRPMENTIYHTVHRLRAVKGSH